MNDLAGRPSILLVDDDEVFVEAVSAVLESRYDVRTAANGREALASVERAARSDENLMPSILEAVEAYATLGEISDRLRDVFGEYKGF